MEAIINLIVLVNKTIINYSMKQKLKKVVSRTMSFLWKGYTVLHGIYVNNKTLVLHWKIAKINDTPSLLEVGLLQGQNMICDHEIAPVYFTESFNKTQKFFGIKKKNLLNNPNTKSICRSEIDCLKDKNCAEMGIHAEDYKGIREGSYYVKTTCD